MFASHVAGESFVTGAMKCEDCVLLFALSSWFLCVSSVTVTQRSSC